MAENFQKPCIWILLTGILLIIAGIYSFFHPLAALAALALILGIVFIVAGVGYLAAFFAGGRSGWFLALGLLDILVGIVFVSNLRQTIAVLPFMFAFWCLFSGSVQISAAVQTRKIMPEMWLWPLISGIVGVIVGFWILFDPLAGAVAITILLGVYLLISGIASILEYAGGCKITR